MNPAKYEQLFSKARMKKYFSACGEDQIKAIQVYQYNIQASQALYPIISILEVTLRNCIDRELKRYFNDADWLLTQRKKFTEDANLIYKNNKGIKSPDLFFKQKIQKIEKMFTRRGIKISHNKLLTELSFGFWVKFFDSGPVKMLKGVQLQAFKNKPRMPLTKFHSSLNAIVALRNRISHNEPICFDRMGKICLKNLKSHHQNVLNALKWLDEDLSKWSSTLDYYHVIIVGIEKLFVV